MHSALIKFWGVRGSIPTPGASTIFYGGNTPCVEVQFKDGPLFILDAGTGIRELGKDMMQRKESISAYIFLSHYHWDHIQGLPFFRPAHDERNAFTIIGSDDTNINLDEIISFQMDPKYFPIEIRDMKANISFRSIHEETFEIEGVQVSTIYLNHPGYALGFRFDYLGKSIIYISDNEPFHHDHANENSENSFSENDSEALFNSFVENRDRPLVDFCANADILIHDTQFLPDEYQDRKTWGHSPFNFTAELAMKSNVGHLILFHHDPDHNDTIVKNIERLSREIIENAGRNIRCDAAREREIIEI